MATLINTLLVQCVGYGPTIEDAKANMELSFNYVGANYGTRGLIGYTGHGFQQIDGTFTRYFDFAFDKEPGDPDSISVVNGVVE